MILVGSFISINSMEPAKYNSYKKKSNLKVVSHSNEKIVFFLPIIPNEREREGFAISKESFPYRVIGTFPGARYRQCVEHAVLSNDGKHFVFVTGAQYGSFTDDHIKNVFVVDARTLQTVDMISYHDIISVEIKLSDDGRYLTIPKRQGGSMLYDIMQHRHV